MKKFLLSTSSLIALVTPALADTVPQWAYSAGPPRDLMYRGSGMANYELLFSDGVVVPAALPTTLVRHVATNAILAVTATATYPIGVFRDDYAAVVNAGPLWFTPLVGTCATNSLVNDGGTCVNSTDGNSWRSHPNSPAADVRQYGAIADGATDNTTAIQNAINANSAIYFPKGSAYVASNLTAPHTLTVYGDGSNGASILKFKTGSTGWLLDAVSYAVAIRDLEVDGGNTSDYSGVGAPGTRSGVRLLANVDNSSIRGANIHGFNNIGLGLNGDATAQNNSVIVAENQISYNYCGLDTEASGANHDTCLGGSANVAEYIGVDTNNIIKNRYGVIASGNEAVTGNSIIRNGYGFYMANVTNSGHGTLTGNKINHNTLYSLYSPGVGNGYSIVGNQLFFGNVDITGLSGQFMFTANTFVISQTLNIAGAGKFSFVNNYFHSTPIITDTSTAPLGTIWDGNYDITAQKYIEDKTALLVDAYGISASSTPLTGTTDLVTNGNFAAGATGWTVGAGWTIVAEATATAANGFLSQNIGATTNTLYSVTYTVSGYSAGSIRVGVGGSLSGATHSANGTYTDIVGTGGTSNGIFYLIPSTFTGVVDDVHVYSYTKVGTISVGKIKFSKVIYSAATNPVPTCNAGLLGTEIAVSDATAPTYGGAYTSGGAVYALMFCDGAAWSTH